MTLDKVNDRLFIGHHGNSRYDVYQLNETGLPARRHADYGIGRSLIGRGFAFAPLGRTYLNFPSNASYDSVHQRLFVPDNSSLGHPGYRIMVFDSDPDTLAQLERNELPEAIAVLGQPNFDVWDPGVGPAKINGRGVAHVAEDRQILFYSDTFSNRVLVWDIHPDRLASGMDAMYVIGQPDFFSSDPGISSGRLSRPGSVAYDPDEQHLFVMDGGNHRVLVFDASPGNLRSSIEAFAVIGQEDFMSSVPRTDLRKIGVGPMSLDYEYDRLFVGEAFGNRMVIIDVSPETLDGALNPDAIAVLGQPDFESTEPVISQTRLTMPRITVDTERQLAYVPDGYPAGNRINIFDIHPDRLQPVSQPLLDQIGHINPEGEPNFESRSANDRTSPRYWTQARDISLDSVDHRLFVSDNYGHRVMIFQLDRMNRILERGARWVLGQPDGATSLLRDERNASTVKLPLAVEYDESHKRLFVADTWSDRVLVFNMTPGQVESGMEASYVLGQADFESYDPRAARDRIYFGSRAGRGIYTTEARAAELAMDERNQRLFVTDGGNHRVLVFDVHPDRIANGAEAIAVIGQDDFTARETSTSATRWELPGDLVLDEENQRLFVGVAWQHRVLAFDVHPDRLSNGQAASFVIGQPDFTSGEPGLSASRFRQTDGLSYDDANHQLFVTDKYNHRVLVYEVPPDRTDNLPEASAVIGERTFDRVEMGPGDPRNFQDRLHDPRGSHFDSVDRRLFQSEGLNGRLSVFTMPREDFRMDLPARSRLGYESLDAQLSIGPEPLTTGYSEVVLSEPAAVTGVSSHLFTRAVMDPDSERQSRVLEAEAILAAPEPAESSLLYFDNRPGHWLAISVVNGNATTADVQFQLLTTTGETRSESRTIEPLAKLDIGVAELFPDLGAEQGALRVTSNEAVAVGGILLVDNGAGATLLVPTPRAEANALLAERRVLPAVTTGAGQRIAYVLLNSSAEPAEGVLEIDGQAIPYTVPPAGAFVSESGGDTRPLATGFGIVRATAGEAPSAFALVMTETRVQRISSTYVVPSHQEGTLFWAPVDTYPGILRHGDIDVELSLVNEGRVPATVYLELFDLDGNSTAKLERIVPLGRRVQLSLEDAFGETPLRGTLRVFSDVQVATVLQRKLVNVVGDTIVTDIPLQPTPETPADKVIFPFYANGEGASTEMLVVNTGRTDHEGSLRVRATNGDVQTTILR